MSWLQCSPSRKAIVIEVLSAFPQFLRESAGIVAQIRPLPLSSLYFVVNS